jgi:ribonuclease HI
MRLHVFSDGACWGNPGPAAIGAIVSDESQKPLIEISEYIGEGTNNQAEYRALLEGLKAAGRLRATELVLHLDSELIIRQLSGRYEVKNVKLIPIYEEVKKLLRGFSKYTVNQLNHSTNEDAHNLAKAALKKHVKK